MFKRFVARCLVGLQVYGSLFQGLAHANLVQHYPVRDEIYLHGSLHKDGGLRISLGTNAAMGSESGSELEVLGVINIPSYQTLKGLDQSLSLQSKILQSRLSAESFKGQRATYRERVRLDARVTPSPRDDDFSPVASDSETATKDELDPSWRSAWMDAPSYELRVYRPPTPGYIPQAEPSSALEGLSPTLEAHSSDGEEKAGSVYGEDVEGKTRGDDTGGLRRMLRLRA